MINTCMASEKNALEITERGIHVQALKDDAFTNMFMKK